MKYEGGKGEVWVVVMIKKEKKRFDLEGFYCWKKIQILMSDIALRNRGLKK